MIGAVAITADPNNFILPPFGQGTGPIHWDDVSCTGSEQRLQDCPLLAPPGGSTDCTHSEDVGVRCQPLPQETTASTGMFSVSNIHLSIYLIVQLHRKFSSFCLQFIIQRHCHFNKQQHQTTLLYQTILLDRLITFW